MTKPFKPLLGDPLLRDKTQWPMLMSTKIDGIRVLIRDEVLTKSLKLVPNADVRFILGAAELQGLDGEIVVGSPTAEDAYNTTQSYVMAKKPKPPEEFHLHVFDDFTHPSDPFEARYARAMERVEALARRFPLKPVFHARVHSLEEMDTLYAQYLDDGFEGGMLRRPDGVYKFGRSTSLEGILLKHKPKESFEAEIISVYEGEHNLNEATLDELGHTKRSSHKEGKVAAGTLGGLVSRRLSDGVIFRCGIFKGLKAPDLKKLWDERETLPGRFYKGESFAIGEKNLPRHPRWTGWWTKEDQSLA